MIPILYEENEKDFSTNGLGGLSDAVVCTVTEVRNGEYELYMKYPVTGKMFTELKHSRIIYATPSDGAADQAFRIYKIGKELNGLVEVYAEHVSYQMSHIPVAVFSASDVRAALIGLKGNAVETCPFEFWTDKDAKGNFEIEVPASLKSKLVGEKGSIVDVYGGEFEYDMYTVKLHANRGTDNGVLIKYGKNLTDLKQEENIQNTITGIYPYYKDSEGNMITLPEKTVSSENAANYPYNRTVPVDLSGEFDETPTVEELRNAAETYNKDNNVGIPSVSMTVSYQQIWKTEEYKDSAPIEHVKLCDTVAVEFEKLGVSAKAKVNKTVYNVLLDRYDSIEFGDVKSNLSDVIIEQKKDIEEKPTAEFLQQAILEATAQITGNKGGYILYMYDGDKHPYEMLIMDTDDIATATNVWRFNKAGIGHSTTGYNGPYTTAITQDGKIVADFITTGNLMASIIKSGILSDISGLNYWNMETGEFVAKNIKLLGGTINIETTDETKGIITLKAGSTKIEIRPNGFYVFLNADGDSGTYYAISKDGLIAGDASYGFATVMTEIVKIGKDNSTGRFEIVNNQYPSFTFATSDGKSVTVKGGVIKSVS